MTTLLAQRTLVKSPPELWSEFADAVMLGRLLADQFGEITITATEPERRVVWASAHASGCVELTPSGWGTRVTLTAELALGIGRSAAEAALAGVLDEVGMAHHRPFSRS
jgi:hypothetical protein